MPALPRHTIPGPVPMPLRTPKPGRWRTGSVAPLRVRPEAPRSTPPQAPKKGRSPDSSDKPEDENGRILVCRACGRKITRPEARTMVNGKHVHVFCNPLGVVYEVACFAFAGGLAPEGDAHEEFSWFPGHAWRIVNCARCGLHLGWRFADRAGPGFHGLLPSRLLEKSEG